MIGIGIAAVLGIILVMGFTKFSKRRKLEDERVKLEQLQQFVYHQIQKDMHDAVKVDGYSSAHQLFGIYRSAASGAPITPAGPRSAPTDNDGLVLYIQKNASLSLPVSNRVQVPTSGPGVNPPWISFTFDIQASGDPVVHNLRRYMATVMQNDSNGFFFNSNPIKSNLFVSPAISSNATTMTMTVTIDQTDIAQAQNEFLKGLNQVTQVLRVEYYLDGNRLKRRVRSSPDVTISDDVVVTGVQKFQLNYIFQDKRAESHSALILPDHPISHPEDPAYLAVCGVLDPALCAKWSDVAAAQLTMSTSSESEVTEMASFDPTSAFQIANNHLILAQTFSISPAKFSSMNVGQGGSSGPSDCLPSNPHSRCRADCAGSFSGGNGSPDPASPNWEGYGRFIGTSDPLGPSDYCVCMQGLDGSGNLPPETREGYESIIPWTAGISSNDLIRLEACEFALSPCGSMQYKDQRLQNLCSCNYAPENYIYNRSAWSWPDNISILKPAANDLRNFYATWTNPPGDRTSLYFRQLRCEYYQTCSVTASAWANTPVQVFDRKCECLTYGLDSSGNDDPTRPIAEKNFAKLCTDYCPLSEDGGKAGRIYYTTSGSFIQGLSIPEATLCQCQASTGTPASATADYRANAIPGLPPPGGNGDPVIPGGSVRSGSRESLAFDVMIKAGGASGSPTTLNNQYCDESECSEWPSSSLGCCTNGADNIFQPSMHAVYTNHGSYCNSSCTAIAEIMTTRRVILGLDPVSGELPNSCRPDGGNGGNIGQ
jgi:hypothetical protein